MSTCAGLVHDRGGNRFRWTAPLPVRELRGRGQKSIKGKISLGKPLEDYLRHTTFKLSILSFLLLLAGCGGGDGESFIVTPLGANPAPPPPPSPGTTGNLAFRFVQAQTAEVPAGTETLQFDFFNVEDDLVFFAPSNYAPSVTVEDVPVTAVRVVITVYGPSGVPLATLSKAVTVEADNTVAVNMSDAERTEITLDELQVSPTQVELALPVNSTASLRLSGSFSNGDTVVFSPQTGGTATFAGANPSVALVSSAGVVTAVTAGSTAVSVSYSLNGQTVDAPLVPIRVTGEAVPIIPARLTFSPPVVALPANSTRDVVVTYFPPNSNTGTVVTADTIGASLNPRVTYSAGRVAASNDITSPTDTLITVSYSANGQTVTGTLVVNVSVGPPVPPAPLGVLEVQPASLTFSNDGVLGIFGGDPSGVGLFRAYFTPNGSTQRSDVTAFIGVSYSNFLPDTVTSESFSYQYLGSLVALGLPFQELYGAVFTSNPLGPLPPLGTRATMTVTYIFQGVAHTDTVELTIGEPTVQSVDFVVAPGGTLRLPQATTNFPIHAYANYSNGMREPVTFCGCDPFNNDWNLVLTGAPTGTSLVEDFDDANGNIADVINTGAADGTATLSLFLNGAATPIGSFNLEVLPAGVTATGVALTPNPLTVNEQGRYNVVVTYSDGTTQDMTAVYKLRVPPASDPFVRPIFTNNGIARMYEGILRGLDTTTTAVQVSLRPNQGFTLGGGNPSTAGSAIDVNVTAVDPSFVP